MNLKSFLFDDSPPVAAKLPTPVQPLPASSVLQIPTGIETHSAVDADMTTTFVNMLRSKYSESPFDAVIQQFHSTIEALSDSIPEEGNRFRAALKVLGFSMTPDKIVAAYQSYSAVLDAAQVKFKAAMQLQATNEVSTREAKLQAINQQIDAKNAELKAMMDQRDNVATEKMVAENKINTAQTSFESALRVLHLELSDRLNKLKVYLPAVTK